MFEIGKQGMEAKEEKQGMIERIVVTGGAGYLGSVVVKLFLKAGFFADIIDRLTWGAHGVLGVWRRRRTRLHHFDISRDDGLVNILSGAKAVIHLAALVGEPIGKQIPDEMKQSFLIAVQESFGIIAPLRHAVMCFVKGVCPIEVTRQHSKEVGLKESNLDSIEWDVTKEIFNSNIDYGHKIHLKLCLEAIIRVSDRAENAADQLELTAVKSTMI